MSSAEHDRRNAQGSQTPPPSHPESLLLRQPARGSNTQTRSFDHIGATAFGLGLAALIGLSGLRTTINAEQIDPRLTPLAIAAIILGIVSCVWRKRFALLPVAGFSTGILTLLGAVERALW